MIAPSNFLIENLKLRLSQFSIGKAPEKYFENAITRCVAFQGIDKRFISDDQPFGGSLYRQFIQAMKWLRGKLNIAYDIEGQGSEPRKEIWEIPETVFKEAIINSLSHRDYYDKGAVTVIEVFDDRVEISNPGGLVSAITEAEFGKRSHSRNPLIFGLFAKMHLVEQVGSGVVRMKELMRAAGLNAPAFQKDGIFTISLLRPLKLEKSSQKSSLKPSLKTKDKVLVLIKQNSKITILELSQLLHKSRRAIELQIKWLKENELIKQLDSEIIVLENKKGLMPNTGGLSVDTNVLPADTGLNYEKKILSYLLHKDNVTVKKAAELLGLKESRTREKLKEMTEKGLIEKHGKARNTIYKKKNN